MIQPTTMVHTNTLLPTYCPVTGLPIRSQLEWVYTIPESTYRMTIVLIGDHLFWLIPRVCNTRADRQQAIAMATAIKAESHPRDDPLGFIENFWHTRGPS